MSNPQNKMFEKFEELKGRLKDVQVVPVLSKNTMRSFCIGFHLPLTGSLYFLLDNTTAYLKIQCLAQVEHGGLHTIRNFDEYDQFARSIEDIQAPTTIDFTFSLTESIYNINGVSMSDINVTFSVYFLKDKYEVVYTNGHNELRFSKRYNEDVEPEDVLELRNKICDNIFNRITENMDAMLRVN